jgi:hypothetical protein
MRYKLSFSIRNKNLKILIAVNTHETKGIKDT